MEDKNRIRLCLGLLLTAASTAAAAQEGGTGSPPGRESEAPSADAIAEELSNPAVIQP